MKPFSPILCLLVLILQACGSYTVNLNDLRLYTPPPLLSELAIPDPNLAICLKQLIIDQQVRKPEDLKIVNCTHADIGEITGLQVFTHLQRINLNDNQISDLSPLADMVHLRVLLLTNNRVGSLSALLNLEKLTVLDLEGNQTLRCKELDKVSRRHNLAPDLPVEELQLTRPAHCKPGNVGN